MPPSVLYLTPPSLSSYVFFVSLYLFLSLIIENSNLTYIFNIKIHKSLPMTWRSFGKNSVSRSWVINFSSIGVLAGQKIKKRREREFLGYTFVLADFVVYGVCICLVTFHEASQDIILIFNFSCKHGNPILTKVHFRLTRF